MREAVRTAKAALPRAQGGPKATYLLDRTKETLAAERALGKYLRSCERIRTTRQAKGAGGEADEATNRLEHLLELLRRALAKIGQR